MLREQDQKCIECYISHRTNQPVDTRDCKTYQMYEFVNMTQNRCPELITLLKEINAGQAGEKEKIGKVAIIKELAESGLVTGIDPAMYT